MSIRSLANTTNLSTQKFSARRVSSSANLSSKKFNVRSIISPVQGYFVTISPAYNGNTTIDLTTSNLTIANSGTWTIVPLVTFAVNIAMWGAGGQTATNGVQAGAAGAGGYSHGTITFNSGTSYTIRVGRFDGGGVGLGDAGNGGGYTGIFTGTETFANSVMIAGAGAGGAKYYNSTQNAGAGGGPAGQGSNGGGGTQSAGGAGGNAGNPGAVGSAGGQLTGGAGAEGNAGYQGSGGGSGYYGGGGGGARAGGDGISGAGGGGSGYLHPSLVSNGNTQTGSTSTAANSASGLRGTSGNVDSNGKIIFLRAL